MTAIRDQDLALVRQKIKHAAQLDCEGRYQFAVMSLLHNLNHVALTIYRIKDWTFRIYTSQQQTEIAHLNALADALMQTLSNHKKRTHRQISHPEVIDDKY